MINLVNLKRLQKRIPLIFLAILMASYLPCRAQSSENDRPNILLIVADDMGEEVGCYGDPYAMTPHIDQFARDGIQFTNAYVTQASCSPSRSSILTGLYPHQNGQTGLSHLGISMHKPYPNLFSILKEHGYYNGIMGKLHVEPHSAFPYDYGIGGFDLKNGVDVAPKDLIAEVINTDGTSAETPEKFTRYDITVMADSAARFMQRAGDRPFFLMMNYLDPHKPFRNQISGYPNAMLTADEVKVPAYCGEADARYLLDDVVGYYNGISRFDAGLGMVMRKLDSLQLRENTMIIVLGDHGAPLPRAKTTVYEAGLRIPMMMQWTGSAAKGKHDSFVSTIDILPTVLDAAGIDSLPDNVTGISWLDLLAGKVKQREYVAGEFIQHAPQSLFPQRAITNGTHKLIYSPLARVYRERIPDAPEEKSDNSPLGRRYARYSRTPVYELFDLAKDPHEFDNVADDLTNSAVLNQLKLALTQWQTATQDPLMDQAHVAETAEQIEEYITEFYAKH